MVTSVLLQPNQPLLLFVTPDSGADMWHQHEDGHWDADEAYEAATSFEWDRISFHRMLLKVVSQREEGGQSGRRLQRIKVSQCPLGPPPACRTLTILNDTKAALATRANGLPCLFSLSDW